MIGYVLDPEGRPRETIFTGKVVATATSHYGGSGVGTPNWSGEASGKWERNISDINGEPVAAHTMVPSPRCCSSRTFMVPRRDGASE